jgi:hypothetical protein
MSEEFEVWDSGGSESMLGGQRVGSTDARSKLGLPRQAGAKAVKLFAQTALPARCSLVVEGIADCKRDRTGTAWTSNREWWLVRGGAEPTSRCAF